MATEAKEGVKLHSKSSTTPSTPRRPGSVPVERQTTPEPPEDCTGTAEQERPIPNYLRPTISSCRSIGRQPKSPAAKKPVDRSQSSSLLLKERSPKPSSSPLPRPSVASKPKNAKAPVLSKSKSFSKAGIDAAKKREGKQEERAIAAPALSKSSSFSRIISTSGITKKIEARQEVKIKEPAELKNDGNGEEEKEKEERKAGNDKAYAAKNERAVVLKRQESKGRESSQPYNEVIEETASKLAAERRNKVKALVGAFETVILLHESEGQQGQSPQKGETKVASPQKGEANKINSIVDEKIAEKPTVNIYENRDRDRDGDEVETKVNALIHEKEEENETKIEEKEDKEMDQEEKTSEVSHDNVEKEEESQHGNSNEIRELTCSIEEVNAEVEEEESNAATELTELSEEENSAEKKLAGDGQL